MSELRTDKVIPFAWSDLGDQKSKDSFVWDKIEHCCYPDERQNVSKFLQSLSKVCDKKVLGLYILIGFGAFYICREQNIQTWMSANISEKRKLELADFDWMGFCSIFLKSYSLCNTSKTFSFVKLIWYLVCLWIKDKLTILNTMLIKNDLLLRLHCHFFPRQPPNQPAPFNLPEWR